MVSTDTIGARMRYWRVRRGGMTQGVLAGLAGVSQSYISQVEAGRKGIERRSTLIAIAAALKVTVADLLGQPGDPTDPAKAGAADAVPAVWTAMIEIENGDLRPPTRGREELAAAISHVDDLRARADYPSMAPFLPDLLHSAAANGGLPLARVAYQTSTCLRHIGYRHLALPAARLAVAAAQTAEHPAWVGAGRFAYALSLPIEAARTAGRVTGDALTDLQAAAGRSTAARHMLGQMYLSAAFVAAVDGNIQASGAYLASAEEEAQTLGDPEDGAGFNRSCFGPTNVGLWRMSVAAELGEHGRVIELARTVNPGPLRMANRHQAYWMTLGSALAHSGRTDKEALTAFVRAERAAPTLFAMSPLTRDSVGAMVRRARHRSVSEDLRILARRIGVDADA